MQSLIHADGEEIVFTSGGSESNNTVLKGIIDLRRPGDFHIITSAVEHPAILNPALFLLELGVQRDHSPGGPLWPDKPGGPP